MNNEGVVRVVDWRELSASDCPQVRLVHAANPWGLLSIHRSGPENSLDPLCVAPGKEEPILNSAYHRACSPPDLRMSGLPCTRFARQRPEEVGLNGGKSGTCGRIGPGSIIAGMQGGIRRV